MKRERKQKKYIEIHSERFRAGMNIEGRSLSLSLSLCVCVCERERTRGGVCGGWRSISSEGGVVVRVSSQWMCVCVCVMERQRGREYVNWRGHPLKGVCVCVCVWVCVIAGLGG